jgi:hypothetical protein
MTECNNIKEQRRHNTGLAKVAVQCSASTFVVKIATFAKPENVSVHWKTETTQKTNKN